MIAVFIPGDPASQGSKVFKGISKSGRGIMIESCKRLPAWRNDVRAALIDDHGQPKAFFDGPIHLEIEFVLRRPKSAPKKREPLASKKPDLSKLLRAVEDAVTSAGIWRDDAQVVSVTMEKRIAKIDETPGCHLFVTAAGVFEKRKAA